MRDDSTSKHFNLDSSRLLRAWRKLASLLRSTSCQGRSAFLQLGSSTYYFLQIFFAVSGAGSGTVMVLLLTELMGLYTVSSVVLIRRQLPQKYRQGLCLYSTSSASPARQGSIDLLCFILCHSRGLLSEIQVRLKEFTFSFEDFVKSKYDMAVDKKGTLLLSQWSKRER